MEWNGMLDGMNNVGVANGSNLHRLLLLPRDAVVKRRQGGEGDEMMEQLAR